MPLAFVLNLLDIFITRKKDSTRLFPYKKRNGVSSRIEKTPRYIDSYEEVTGLLFVAIKTRLGGCAITIITILLSIVNLLEEGLAHRTPLVIVLE